VDDRHLRRARGLAWCVLLLLAASPAHADDGPRLLKDAITVQAGATCIDLQDLADEVGTWLATDRVDPDVWVHVQGSPEDPRVAWFEMGRGKDVLAHRRFDPGPDRCDHLEAMMGLAIALAIKVSLLDELTVRTPTLHAEPPPPPESNEAWGFGADGLLTLGVVPGLAAGLDLRLERSFPPNFVLRAGLLGLAGNNGTFDRVTGAFSTEIAAARVDACVRQVIQRVRIGACTGVLAGGLFLQGRDFPSSRSAAAPWAALGSGVELGVDLGVHWSLGAQVAVTLPFGRTTAGAVSATGNVVDTRDVASVGGMLSLGPTYRF
jgi:hypothetical protein